MNYEALARVIHEEQIKWAGEYGYSPLHPVVPWLQLDDKHREHLVTAAAHAWERLMTPCTAKIHHGPGHQSSTVCELKGPHEVHRAIYGSRRQEATWSGDNVFTGFFDEPPEEPE